LIVTWESFPVIKFFSLLEKAIQMSRLFIFKFQDFDSNILMMGYICFFNPELISNKFLYLRIQV